MPERSAILFFVDGFDRDVFDELLAAGQLPNIDRYLVRRGARVENAVTCIPSITCANAVTMMTGRYPGRHDILGNKWFDRRTLVYRSYMYAETCLSVNGDFTAPTVYEAMPDKLTVTIRGAVQRGVKHVVPTDVEIGVCFFMGWFEWADGWTVRSLEFLPDIARREKRWPDFITLYCPGLDEVGHQFGSHSPRYRSAARNIDLQIGKLCGMLESTALLERTYLLLATDHGHEPLPHHQALNPTEVLRRRYGWRIHNSPIDGGSMSWRQRYFNRIDAVDVNGGSRRYGLWLRGPEGWASPPPADQCREIMAEGDAPLARLDSVLLGAYRSGADQVRLVSRDGEATVTRRMGKGGREYRYDAAWGDPLALLAEPDSAAFVAAGWHDSRAWLKATAAARHPDVVAQIVEAFDSPRSPDILLFAREGWDFERGHAGGHGSIGRRDMRVPMLVAGPGIPAGHRVPTARVADIAPTIVELLAGREGLARLGDIDGVSLVPELMNGRPAWVHAR